MNKDIKNITVLGAGTMGHGIAHVFSRFGYQVNLYEPFDQVRESAMDKIMAELSFMVEEKYITADEDVDRALMAGPAFRNATTGMLECADLGGLDIWCASETNFFPDLCNDDKPSESMRKLVADGHFGIKTGKGFFEYPPEKQEEIQQAFNRRLITQLKASRNYKK